jgi:hypothetical protein
MGIRVSDAIMSFYPKAIFQMSTDDDYEHLTWLSTDIPKPSKEELLQKVEQLKAERPLKDLRAERDRRLAAVDWVTSRATSTETPVPPRVENLHAGPPRPPSHHRGPHEPRVANRPRMITSLAHI